MPELPEVESLRRTLLPHLIARRIVDARLLRRDVLIVPGDPPGGFSRRRGRGVQARATRARRRRPFAAGDLLVGAVIVDIARRGKQLAILAADGRALVVQLGMTGHLELIRAGATPPGRHVHAVWTLDPRTTPHHGRDAPATLVFEDARRFGALRAFRSRANLDSHWSALGPDALAITGEHLHAALNRSARSIKAALLDQAVLAGVGNIYADEALFAAKISPATRARRLRPADFERLAAAIRRVLVAATEAGGSTLRDYSDANGRPGSFQDAHAVYGRAGLPCSVCSTRLRSRLLAQRTTVWCPSCQKSPGRERATRSERGYAQVVQIKRSQGPAAPSTDFDSRLRAPAFSI